MTESSGRFEWDNEKNNINIKKHGIDLSDIPEITKEQWEKGHFKNQPALSVSIDAENGYPVAVQG